MTLEELRRHLIDVCGENHDLISELAHVIGKEMVAKVRGMPHAGPIATLALCLATMTSASCAYDSVHDDDKQPIPLPLRTLS